MTDVSSFFAKSLRCTLYFILCCLVNLSAQAQESDTGTSIKQKMLEEVVVSASRSERRSDKTPVPVVVISSEAIRQSGAVRLNEILREQTGIQMNSDHGTGVQIQGLSSDYVLVLIDGEPVIGRLAGTFDIGRLATENIERVEIIKGPSSSLYGSDALAGIINIITKKQRNFSSTLSTRYRSFNTFDLSTSTGYRNEKFGIHGFFNRLSTNGYKLDPTSYGMTAPPFAAYTAQLKGDYLLTTGLKVAFSGRFFTDLQKNKSLVFSNGQDRELGEKELRREFSWMTSVEQRFGKQHCVTAKNYLTTFRTQSEFVFSDNKELYDRDNFRQFFNQTEILYTGSFDSTRSLSAGVGYREENAEAIRYAKAGAFRNSFIFAQYDQTVLRNLLVSVGFRYDMHNRYQDRFSPKLAAEYRVSSKVSLSASAGAGYKAPDFRQLLLDFSNPVEGYNVFGSQVVREGVERLQSQGQIQALYIDPEGIQDLKAETSWAFNVGGKYKPTDNTSFQLHVFHNTIDNLIETAIIALKTNNRSVYTYFNINQIVTQGIEAQYEQYLFRDIRLSAGYQFLDAWDPNVKVRIQNGEIFKKDPKTNETVHVTLKDYGGLLNRSRHSGNIKLSYENLQKKINVSLRGIYRGRFGFGDTNGNGILDDDREYVKGYMLWNVRIAKTFYKHLEAELGMNNIFNKTNIFVPSLPGRMFYAGLSLKLESKKR